MREKFGGYMLQRPSDGSTPHVYIDDTTLRDGEQTAGVVFANEEKLRIAKLLDEVGVHQIEAGIPTMGGDEKEAVAAIAAMGLNCSILAWNRAVVSDVQGLARVRGRRGRHLDVGLRHPHRAQAAPESRVGAR